MHIVHGMQDIARYQAAEDAGDWIARHQERHHLAPAMGRKPKGEIEHDAREKPCLGNAQEESRDVELHGGLHQRGRRRDQRPGDHDARDPAPCSDPVQNHVAGHFGEEIADEEHTGAQAIHRVAEGQIVEHGQLGEADVDPVQVTDDVAKEQQWHESPHHLLER
ncbi:hypothetical protein D3C85_1454050 [compost metagenome]